ncbi:MAG: DUF354 domain-containing protein [Syntrophales bacterium LBB04]|nr:DUF354 domain-containing protein [Syntrophales bacterium LBB04]
MSISKTQKTIWIDLDNSPHVPFFVPIIHELEKSGHRVLVTIRDSFQVRGLADRYQLRCKQIGKHYGANKLLKVCGTIWRSLQLAPIILKEKPDVSISHGSRSLTLLSSVLHIPTILLFDYEHARRLPFIKPTLGIAPEVIDASRLAKQFKRGLRTYSGLKEDVYVASFTPGSSILQELNLKDDEIIATIRPPATEAHYHNPESEKLFCESVEFLGSHLDIRMIILPRNEKTQTEFVRRAWPRWCEERKIIIPDRVVNGLDLIWHSDLVISGGGTMNREAAALGVPVYSIFRGPIGAVDQYLADAGGLTLIETPRDVRARIQVAKRRRETDIPGKRRALGQIMTAIEEVLDRLPGKSER